MADHLMIHLCSQDRQRAPLTHVRDPFVRILGLFTRSSAKALAQSYVLVIATQYCGIPSVEAEQLREATQPWKPIRYLQKRHPFVIGLESNVIML